tara:strand:+ start:58 stop:729 length:672 start_codon:yes stop_codon:yes gene_type:complete
MADLNATKWGRLTGTGSNTFSTARTSNASSFAANPTTANDTAIFYNQTGRGSSTFNRTFYYFDTSGITGTVSSVTLNILGHSSGNDGDIIVTKSTAFGGDGSADIVASDMPLVTYATPYSSEVTEWTLNGNNAISLNAAANSDIQNNDFFILAVINHDNDYSNSEAGSATQHENGIANSTVAYLSYTEAASGYTHDVNGVAAASIGKVSSVATASIGKINSVD